MNLPTVSLRDWAGEEGRMKYSRCPFVGDNEAHFEPVQCVRDEGHDGPHDIGCTICGEVLVRVGGGRR